MGAAAMPDVIVCGAGTAGCVVAGRLVESGARVLLLEAGPDFGPFDAGGWPEGLLDARYLPAGHDWSYTGAGAGGQALEFQRARVVGGCSAHNGCAQTSGWAGDYDRLADELGAPEWSAERLRPLFREASRRLRIRSYEAVEVQPFQRAFLDAAVAMGVPKTDDLDDLDGVVGCGCEPINIVDGVRWNTAFAYLDPVRASPLLDVRHGALVDRVTIDRGRAVSVRAIFDGRPEELSAGSVVICGGVYGTPELLLRSGIGPSAELSAIDIAVSQDMKGVGRNLHDQPAAHLEFTATPELAAELELHRAERWMPEEQVIAKLATPLADGPYDLHVYPWVEPDADQPSGWRCVIPAALLTPRSRGRVQLRSADPTERASLDHAFLSDPGGADVDALAHGVAMVQELIASAQLRDQCGEALLFPPPHDDREALVRWIRATHRHYWHPAGTCRMGTAEDPDAVVDPAGGVYGIANLTVADASVLPRVSRSTTALPVVVVAERIAASLVGR